jgi:hypothetical protein
MGSTKDANDELDNAFDSDQETDSSLLNGPAKPSAPKQTEEELARAAAEAAATEPKTKPKKPIPSPENDENRVEEDENDGEEEAQRAKKLNTLETWEKLNPAGALYTAFEKHIIGLWKIEEGLKNNTTFKDLLKKTMKVWFDEIGGETETLEGLLGSKHSAQLRVIKSTEELADAFNSDKKPRSTKISQPDTLLYRAYTAVPRFKNGWAGFSLLEKIHFTDYIFDQENGTLEKTTFKKLVSGIAPADYKTLVNHIRADGLFKQFARDQAMVVYTAVLGDELATRVSEVTKKTVDSVKTDVEKFAKTNDKIRLGRDPSELTLEVDPLFTSIFEGTLWAAPIAIRARKSKGKEKAAPEKSDAFVAKSDDEAVIDYSKGTGNRRASSSESAPKANGKEKDLSEADDEAEEDDSKGQGKRRASSSRPAAKARGTDIEHDDDAMHVDRRRIIRTIIEDPETYKKTPAEEILPTYISTLLGEKEIPQKSHGLQMSCVACKKSLCIALVGHPDDTPLVYSKACLHCGVGPVVPEREILFGVFV